MNKLNFNYGIGKLASKITSKDYYTPFDFPDNFRDNVKCVKTELTELLGIGWYDENSHDFDVCFAVLDELDKHNTDVHYLVIY